MMRLLGMLGFLGFLLTATGAGAAEIIILESTADGIEAGTIMEDTDPVDVPDGAMLLVVEEDGTTREIVGPYSGALAPAASSSDSGGGLIANLGKLVKDRETKRQVLGAIRAAPGQVPPDLYLIDAARSETVCVPQGSAPVLWRPATMAAETEVELSSSRGGLERFIWTGDSQTTEWPAGVSISDGEVYEVRLGIAPRPTELTIRLVPSAIESAPAQAAWMYDAGCRRQAVILVESLR